MIKHNDPTKRHDFIIHFDVTDGNPNGDPDAGNLPRVDPETMQGLVTDVAIKRKIRDFVALARPEDPRHKIYIEHGAVLNEQHQRAFDATGTKPSGSKEDRKVIDVNRKWMCENFFDVRMFGAVMSTGINCGQVRGPLQFTFARSLDPIIPLEATITRVAITTTKDAVDKKTEMGRKAFVPYGLYRAHGFFSPSFARQTGVNEDDMNVLWDALIRMWDLDRSASRGMLSCRRIDVFTHESELGNAPAHKLFDSVKIERVDKTKPARAFSDYQVSVGEPPSNITHSQLIK